MTEGYLQRKASWQVLLKVSSGRYSDRAIDEVLSDYRFNSLDIAFITELSFGCIRYRKYLDLWIDHTSKLSHKKQPPKLRWLLHIGLYQILKMSKIPYSASISTTVESAKKSDLKKLSGVVNAILRNAIKKIENKNYPNIPNNNIDKIAFLDSLPEWLVEEIIDWEGINNAEIIAKSFNKKPSIDFRINTLKTNMKEVIEEFRSSNLVAIEIKDLKTGVELKSKARSIKKLPGFIEGKWVIQDRSSQSIAPLLNPKKGDKILDLCAAPGTKTTHLAELIKDDGEIWAIDRSKVRLDLLKDNLKRLKIKCVKTLVADTNELLKLKPDFLNYFDKVLLDAPCSGIGTLSRNPDARWSLSNRKIDELIQLQMKLLESSKYFLNDNGTLVYSTCTICPRENNLLINSFLTKNSNMHLICEKQILPGFQDNGDGFYAAVIKNKK